MDNPQVQRFLADVEKILGEKALRIQTDQQLRLVAFDLYDGTTKDTPVDTGYLRSSWRLSRATPDRSVPPLLAKGAEISEAQLRVDEQTTKAAFAPDSRVGNIWLTTAVIYALAIEYGHSKVKQPQGMVRTNLARIVAKYSV